jgi:hypothetical protein
MSFREEAMNSRISTLAATAFIVSLLLVTVLIGCATRPSVTYTKITSGTDVSKITDSYYLQSSTITIKRTESSKTSADASAADLQIISTPTEYPRFKVGITSNSSWLGAVSTVINITKLDNTSLVKEIGSEISDKRVDTIKTIGSIITTAAPFVAFANAAALDPAKLPWSTKTYTQVEGNPAAADAGQPLQLADGVTMTLGPLPPDAIPVDKFPSGSSSAFLYAACRDATIEFPYETVIDGKKVSVKHKTTLKIADPRYFELVALPVKGKITTHSECGVSVTTDKDTGVSSGADIANALATQGKAIKDAIDAAKKTPSAK